MLGKVQIKKMKKFIDRPSMEKFFNEKNIPKNTEYVTITEAKHIPLLSKESYIVKYSCDVKFKGADVNAEVIIRGNRIAKTAKNAWEYVFQKSKQSGITLIPTPVYYFKKDNFMIYYEFPGLTLRDYDNNYTVLKKVNVAIGKKLAWWHTLPFKKSFGVHSLGDEKKYWGSVQSKIAHHLPKKNKSKKLKKNLDTIYARVSTLMTKLKPTLAHNDFQASNILYNENKDTVGFIDFGSITGFTHVHDVATYMVHLAVMTNKHMSIKKTVELQSIFLYNYLKNISKKTRTETQNTLPLYQARVAADIMATTAVALKHTNSSYRKIIPKMLIPIVEQKLDQYEKKTRPKNALMVQLTPYHE